MSLILLLPVCAFAQEDEVTAACNLAHAQAEVDAAELVAPSAYFAAGDQLLDKAVIVGVSESLSGVVRAGKLREAASAQCDSFHASVSLDQYLNFAQVDVQKKGAIASLPGLNAALDLSNVQINSLRGQMQQGVVTVADVDAAVAQLADLERRKATTLALCATAIPAFDSAQLTDLARDYTEAVGNSTVLTTQAQAHSGWDLAVAVGGNKPIGARPEGVGLEPKPFVTASVRYSFGTEASLRAARAAGHYMRELMDAKTLGYSQTLARHREEIASFIEVERLSLAAATRQLDSLRLIRMPLEGINTLLAGNARLSLDVQLKAAESNAAGAKSRMAGYQSLLDALK